MINKNTTRSPIALFAYNRPDHIRKTIEALKANFLAKESDLFIFSDGHKNELDKDGVNRVREHIKTISGFKKVVIIEREKNFGLSASIISGVTEIVNKHGKIIVLEDDLVTSRYFLQYANNALDLYENDEDVISIQGYIYPVKDELPNTFFIRGADCQGWGTWKRGWNIFDPDGGNLLKKIQDNKLEKNFNMNGGYGYIDLLKRQIAGKTNSWAIRWYASAFLANKLTLYPGKSLIKNIGLTDGEGTHSAPQNSVYVTEASLYPVHLEKISTKENPRARKIIIKYFKSLRPSLIKRIIQKIKKRL